MIWGGRAPVRTALFLSAWTATRWNPAIRGFHQRLRAKGKDPSLPSSSCDSNTVANGSEFCWRGPSRVKAPTFRSSDHSSLPAPKRAKTSAVYDAFLVLRQTHSATRAAAILC